MLPPSGEVPVDQPKQGCQAGATLFLCNNAYRLTWKVTIASYTRLLLSYDCKVAIASCRVGLGSAILVPFSSSGGHPARYEIFEVWRES